MEARNTLAIATFEFTNTLFWGDQDIDSAPIEKWEREIVESSTEKITIDARTCYLAREYKS